MTKSARIRVYRKDQRLFMSMLGLSAACHLFFGIAVFIIPILAPAPPPPLPFVTVDLVNMSLPASKGPPRGSPEALPQARPAPPSASAIAPLPEPVAEEPEEKAAQIKEEPKPKAEKQETKVLPPVEKAVEKKADKLGEKTAEKKPEQKPQESAEAEDEADALDAKKRALAILAKKVEARSRPDSVNKAIAELKKRADQIKSQQAGGEPTQGVSAGFATSGGGGGSSDLPNAIRMYVDNDFRVHINEKWAFPSALVGRQKKLLAQVLVTVARNGAIAEYTWVERSGNIIFDDSVEKAIKKANPAPPLPGAYAGESFQFGLIFTPPDQ